MGNRMNELKLEAGLLEDQIETAFINGTGTAEDEALLDGLYYGLALIEEELNKMAVPTEVLDNNFDDLDESDYNLFRRVANEDD